MKKEKLMQQEIEEKRKLTEEIKRKIDNNVFYNFWLAVFIMVYMFFINLGYIKLSISDFKLYTKVSTIILMMIIITYFEIAYRRENLKYAVTAIELLILNSLVMYIPYIYISENEIIRKLIMLVPIYYGTYYSIKNYIIYKKEDREHKNNLSDVRQIVKQEDESYLEENSKKIIKERKKSKK